MIELRWVQRKGWDAEPPVRVLQYRHLKPLHFLNGEIDWSEWMDVPIVAEKT